MEEGSLNTGNACTQELKFHIKLGRQTVGRCMLTPS